MTQTEKTDKKTVIAKKKNYPWISVTLILVVLIFAGWKCPHTSNFRRYLLDVIHNNDSDVKVTENQSWAQKIDLPGLPNLHKVSDDLYRGAQPTALGMKQLEMLGIKTIVNLRSLHSDRDELEDAEMAYEHIRMTTLTPETDDIVRFLNIVTDSNSIPVFVHCQHGADRTGVICAIYRVIIQNWSRDEAVKEMTEGGFNFHSIWNNLADYIREMDIDKIKQEAGLAEIKSSEPQ